MKSTTALATGGMHRMPDGRWRFSITVGYDGRGRQVRRSVTAKTKSELVTKRDKLLSEITEKTREKRKITVETWMDYWIDEIAFGTLSPRVRQDYKSKIKRYIKPALGKYRLVDVGADEIRELHEYIEQHEVSSRTRQIVHSVCSAAFRAAIREGHLDRNACDLVGRPRSRSAGRTPLTAAQAAKVILTSIEAEDPLATMWATALLLGARQGELIGLEWNRVNFDTQTVDLSWQAQRLPWAHGYGCNCPPDGPPRKCPLRKYDAPPDYDARPMRMGLAWVRPKTQSSVRLIPLPASLCDLLREHRSRSSPNDWGLVWAGKGKPLHSRYVTGRWREALSRAGVPTVDMHSARHTTASLLLESGAPTEVIVRILGHSSELSTRTYLHVDQGMAADATTGLERLLGLGGGGSRCDDSFDETVD